LSTSAGHPLLGTCAFKASPSSFMPHRGDSDSLQGA
jgi:hypothetical protein